MGRGLTQSERCMRSLVRGYTWACVILGGIVLIGTFVYTPIVPFVWVAFGLVCGGVGGLNG